MKRWILLLAVSAPSLALPDTLQFEIGRGGPFASYAHVALWNRQGHLVYSGTSDGYGRVSLTLPAGEYQATVTTTRAGDRSCAIHLSGADGVETVTL